jgi:cytochrome c peroxidase
MGVTGKPLSRNSPSLFNAARHHIYFWDGRADSLWSQPLFAIEAPDEMAGSRVQVARILARNYPQRYSKLFGPLPDLSGLPENGKPGDPAYDKLPEAKKRMVNQIAANAGKAIEAYVRKLAAGPSDMDRYISGEKVQLYPQTKLGMALFVKKGCIECHSGPNYTDEKFRHIPLDAPITDVGASEGFQIRLANPFNLAGPFAEPSRKLASQIAPAPGTFRTPSLRNVVDTAPYGHAGQWPDLKAAIRGHDIKGLSLSASEQDQLAMFLMSLSGHGPKRPWSGWPSEQ